MIGFDDFSRQGDEIRTIREQIASRQLVHALLITGEPGIGKSTLAGLISSALMCSSDTVIPCGVCAGCRLASSGEHPDITVIQKGSPLSPETAKGRATIPVDDIREMIRLCSRYSFEGGNRAVIIRDAENMTVQAQNSLLKILEEPPRNTYFILTSAHPEQLLTTVKSRCRPLKLIPWENAYIQDLLKNAGTDPDKAHRAALLSAGSIGTAFRLAADDEYWKTREEVMNAFFRNRKRSEVLAFSNGWKDRKSEADTLFGILEDNMHRLFTVRLNPQGAQDINDFPPEWQRFAAEASADKFTAVTDKIRTARKQVHFNVNFQAIIEQLLLTFIGETEQWEK